MTRETKVGLLIGLGLILLVGIIASDALSVRQDSAGNDGAIMTQFAGQAQQGIASSSTPPTPAPLAAMPTPPAPMQSQPLPATADAALPPRISSYDAASTQQTPPAPLPPSHRIDLVPGQPAPLTDGPAPLQSAQAHDRLADGSLPSPPTTWRLGQTDRTGAALSQPDNLPPGVTVVDRPVALSEAGMTDASAGPAPSLPGAEQIYIVSEGESLKTIASRYYGDSDYWRSLAEVNADIVRADGSVRTGDRLRLPNRSGLLATGLFEQVDATRPDGTRTSATLVLQRTPENMASEAPPRTSPAMLASAKKNETLVEVKEGDSLTKLSERHLGTQAHWQALYEANKDQLDSPDRVVVGMKLRLPTIADKPVVTEAPAQPTATAATEVTTTTTASDTKPVGSAKSYTVKAGDSLIRIAERELGSKDRWEDLFKANADALSSPDAIKVGQQIRLPG